MRQIELELKLKSMPTKNFDVVVAEVKGIDYKIVDVWLDIDRVIIEVVSVNP